MLNVLHLYAGNLYGGIERLLATYAEQRHRCPQLIPHFGLCFEGRLATELRAAGAAVHVLGGVRLSRPWTTWAARRRLDRLLRGPARFDAVVTHASWPHAVFAPTVIKRRLPLLFMAHDAYLTLARVDRVAARTRPNFIIANSAYTASTISLLFPGANYRVCHYPVAPSPPFDRTAVRSEVRGELGCVPNRVVIVCMARMERWKGQTLLIEALARLKGDNWEAWIGGGAQRPEEIVYLQALHAQVGALGIGSKARFIGQRSDVPRILAAADIHCQPNLGPEPFGIAFVEALFAGLPVVTTRLGAPADFISDQFAGSSRGSMGISCGRLTQPGDGAALAAALQQLIDDPAERGVLGEGGPSRADELCNVDRQLRVLHDLIRDVVNGTGNPQVTHAAN